MVKFWHSTEISLCPQHKRATREKESIMRSRLPLGEHKKNIEQKKVKRPECHTISLRNPLIDCIRRFQNQNRSEGKKCYTRTARVQSLLLRNEDRIQVNSGRYRLVTAASVERERMLHPGRASRRESRRMTTHRSTRPAENNKHESTRVDRLSSACSTPNDSSRTRTHDQIRPQVGLFDTLTRLPTALHYFPLPRPSG